MNALDMLKRDHAEVEAIFTRLEQGSPDKRAAVLEEAKAEVERHDAKETQVFYPAMRERLGALVGDTLTRYERAHTFVKTEFAALGEMEDKTGVEFLNRAVNLRTQLRAHATDEESNLFPQVRFAFSEDDLNLLGEQMESVA